MNILYLSHSNERTHRRTSYSILSCLMQQGSCTCPITLYTDDCDWYKPFQSLITIEYLSPQQISAWTESARGYRNIVKAEIFQRQEDSFVFFDSDTVLVKPLAPLLSRVTESTSVMQCREYMLGKKREFADLIQDANFPEITATTWMYNSGILGVHKENLSRIKKVKQRVLELLASHKVRTPEQLLDGIFLSQCSAIRTAPGWIYHYWQDKKYADDIIDGLFQTHGLPRMVDMVRNGEGKQLFHLGFRKIPWLYDIFMRISAHLEQFENA